MTPGDSIITRKIGHTLWIELNRPKSLNATNVEMLVQITAQINSAANDKSIRCVFITSIGKAFCVGQDLKDVLSTNPPPIRNILEKGFHPLIETIGNCPVPVFCGVNGPAVGAGFSLALACDLIVAAEGASFQLGFSKIGLIPDAGSTHALVRLLGRHRAAKLMFTDEKLNAARAKDIGLVSEIFPTESFIHDCETYVSQFAEKSFTAMSESKKLLRSAEANILSKQLTAEADAQVKLSGSADFKEGVAAFIEKRQPVYNQTPDE